MAPQHSNLRGILFMVLATLSFSLGDAMMKLATQTMPPFEALAVRGLMASLCAAPMLAFAGHLHKLRMLLNRWVMLRSVLELVAVLAYAVALANMPIADLVALCELTPLFVLLGAALIYGEKVGSRRAALIGVGFVGALMVAQPGLGGFSPFALLAVICAIGSAGRDLVVRKIDADIPGIVVAFGTLVTVMVGGGVMSLLFEQQVVPTAGELGILAAAGLMVTLAHYCMFMSFRVGEAVAIAPFSYTFMVWAFGTGYFIFGTLPNLLGFAGIGLIVASGLALILIAERRSLSPAT